MSTAAVYSDTQYPLVPNPQDRRRYENVASRLIAARAEQTLARTAYGSLQEIGDGYDSDNSEKRHAADMSVDAADDVMKTAAAFLKEQKVLQEKNSKEISQIKDDEVRRLMARAAASTDDVKRRRESTSPPESDAPYKENSKGRPRKMK